MPSGTSPVSTRMHVSKGIDETTATEVAKHSCDCRWPTYPRSKELSPAHISELGDPWLFAQRQLDVFQKLAFLILQSFYNKHEGLYRLVLNCYCIALITHQTFQLVLSKRSEYSTPGQIDAAKHELK